MIFSENSFIACERYFGEGECSGRAASRQKKARKIATHRFVFGWEGLVASKIASARS
jgi:hypothetical protein